MIAPGDVPNRRVVAVIMDGMRRDLVSETDTPHLVRLRSTGTWFASHRSVFPSCTRVVSASFATGCLPTRHGLAGNTVCLIEDERLKRFDVGKPDFIAEKRRLTGRVLNVPTLAERLAGHGGSVVFNNVSPGAAYMHDPDGYGFVYHRAGSYGPGRTPVSKDDALAITQGLEGDAIATERFARNIVMERRPAYALLWLSEPDTTQHLHALGSPEHRAAMAGADRLVARVHEAVEACRREGEDILFIVGSDHGHETVRGIIDIEAELVAAGLKASPESGEVVVAANGNAALVYLSPQGQIRRIQIAAFLKAQPWTGHVIEASGLEDAGLPAGGGLAFAIALATDESPNPYGIPGHSYSARPASGNDKGIGSGQHGGLGRFEQSPFLMIEGADFPPGQEVAPTSAIDIAPTILAHLGRPTSGMNGRPLANV